MKSTILHLQTGGTITWNVPEYKELEDIAHIFLDYVDIGKYVTYSMKAYCEYKFKKICDKDSRDITNVDRQRLVDEITKWYREGINLFMITHWTYTMPDTGVYLEENLQEEILENISVVITWAMYPWWVLWTDAPMNVWASISSLINADKPLWVKISMHGKHWSPDKVEKDSTKLLFHATLKSK